MASISLSRYSSFKVKPFKSKPYPPSLGRSVYVTCTFVNKNNLNVVRHIFPYPRVVDPRETCLRLVQDKEGGQVGGVGGHDDHGEAGPDHPEDAGGKTTGGA